MTNAQSTPTEAVDPQSPPWGRTTRRVVAIVMLALFALVLWRFQGLLAQIVVAWLVAYLLNPVINAIANRFERMSRTAATLIVYALLILVLLTVIGMIGVAAANQINALIENLPNLLADAVEFIANLTNNPDTFITIGTYEIGPDDLDWEQLQTQLFEILNPALETGGSAAGAVAGGAINAIGTFSLTLIISLYIALDLPRFGRDWVAITQQSGYHEDFKRITQELLEIGNAYLRGQAILGLVVGTMTAVLLGILGVQNALAIGILSGFLELVPYFGPLISAVVAVLVAFFQPENYLGWGQVEFAIATLIVMILIQQIENNFLVPRIVGDALNLKPLTVMIAVIMGGALFGLLGIILAGPVAAAIKLVGGYMWRKMLGVPPFPPNQRTARAVAGPSLIGRTLGLIRSRRARPEEVVDPANPARTEDVTPPGEGEPPSAAKH